MKLTELGAEWVSHFDRGKVGMTFKCPCGCGHGIVVMFANPPDGHGPAFRHMPAVMAEGGSFDELTLRAVIDRRDSCGWRGTVVKGEVRDAKAAD